MKKIIGVGFFVVMFVSSGYVITGCGPGHKSTTPANGTDSLGMNNNNSMRDSSTVRDSSHMKNPEK